MPEYRKKNGSDAWHWCRNCSNWPTSDYVSQQVEKGKRPSSGELDNECLGKERNNNCTTS